jgi:phosphomannomutase
MHPSIFRAYDIRGIVGDTLFASDFRSIGQAFATYVADTLKVTQPSIIVMRDGRLTSPLLAGAAMEGLLAAGCHVLDGGVGPTPMCYFATHAMGAHGSIMITGSHNPPQHNGAKFMVGHASLYGKNLASLQGMIARGRLLSGTGSMRGIDVRDAYITRLREVTDASRMQLVWDTGHGAAGEVVEALAQALPGAQHHLLYTRIDGRFPAHHPDPSQPENLRDVQEAIQLRSADIGIALDGDGDRVGIVDDVGRIVSPDHLLMLLARDVLRGKPHAKIIADVKTSDAFFADVVAHGGEPLMWKTGHALIKEKMHETGAAFAGEASGHIFFADRYFGFDDGIYAAMRVIALVQQSGEKLSALIDALPTLHASEEFRIACDDAKKFALIETIAANLASEGASVNGLDGVRVSTPNGWWLLRASNTQAALVGRCEGTTPEACDALIAQLRTRLKALGIEF